MGNTLAAVAIEENETEYRSIWLDGYRLSVAHHIHAQVSWRCAKHSLPILPSRNRLYRNNKYAAGRCMNLKKNEIIHLTSIRIYVSLLSSTRIGIASKSLTTITKCDKEKIKLNASTDTKSISCHQQTLTLTLQPERWGAIKKYNEKNWNGGRAYVVGARTFGGRPLVTSVQLYDRNLSMAMSIKRCHWSFYRILLFISAIFAHRFSTRNNNNQIFIVHCLRACHVFCLTSHIIPKAFERDRGSR